MNLKEASVYDPRARPQPFTFYPPKNNRWVTALVKLGIRGSIRRKLRVTEVEISDEDLERLRRLQDQRCLLTPSHSGGFEPHIVMYLSKLLGQDFNFVAAMELFQQSRVNRWILPRLGVYSVIRGAVDRASFSMTRQLLAAGKRWLVIFPEGQAIWQNSMLIPFQQGVFQLAFKGYEDARKQDPEAHLYCVPIAIKYVYFHEMHAEIDQSLAKLEAKLGIVDGHDSASRYQRLRRIAEVIVEANEKARGLKTSGDLSLNERAHQLKLHAVSQLEQPLGITPSPKQTLLDRIRAVFNAVDRVVHEEPNGSDYERQLAMERQQAVRSYYEDLWRLLQFVALEDGYVRSAMTFERFLDVLCLLEMEVCRERKIWGPRKALIKVGEPVDLRDWAATYDGDKRSAVPTLTRQIEETIRGMLSELESGCQMVQDSDRADVS